MVEGAVWRLEDGTRVLHLAKWIDPQFVPGKYFPQLNNDVPYWNWHPESQ